MIAIHYYSIARKNIPLLRKWGERLMNEYKEEALETLQEENSTLELVLLSGNMVMAINHYRGKKKPTNMQRQLNQEHCALMKQILQPSKEVPMENAELIYILQHNPNSA